MTPTIGEIRIFAGIYEPRGWSFCKGQLLPISQYEALFAILGTTYGGDGISTFALPDMRGRTPIHPGMVPGLSNISLGEAVGTETNTLLVSNLPAHSHVAINNSVQASDNAATSSSPVNAYPASSAGSIAAININAYSPGFKCGHGCKFCKSKCGTYRP